jgi:hypothetical protein
MPHDAGSAGVTRPVDLHDPEPPALDHGTLSDGADAGGSGEIPPYGPVEPDAKAVRRKRRRQSVLFGASALVIALAAGGFIAHKPLLAALARLREHDVRTASVKPVPLPHPMTSGAVLKAGSGGHTTADPIDNAIPGLTGTSASHLAASGEAPKSLATPQGSSLTSPGGVTAPGTGVVPLIPTNGVPRASTTHTTPVSTASSSAPGSSAIRQHVTPTAATLTGNPGSITNPVAPVSHPAGGTTPGVTAAGSSGYTASPLVGPLPPKGTLQSIPHPVDVAAKLVAAPASTSDEVQTDALVAVLGKLVGQLRSENMQMQNEINMFEHHVDGQLTSFDQRLTYDQAHDTLALAGAAHPQYTPPDAAAPGAPSQIFPARARPVAPVNPASYHIHAASAGLADIYRNGVPYEVSVGSEVPGVGRVISIYQDGSSWIVRTDHGIIR